ncbi:amino acid permease [Sedimentibacter hydroxybenzoicus DSM 7310]|uniref:Amino acid permease n=1 Tax=Sedimentibacter hydroxybenzoicus DSM 7310 TaxID=1123245 RepID=A0A974BN78_SEDHY|nr:amino acid permease [Sedimentibacter hydroxybenzoicus]NYB76046.1 amino acid permease [Sedimentibacter hydroxybenzoicus DSM 7310]
MEKDKANVLIRTMGLKESVTITVGTVIGVGLFTVGANAVGILGPYIFVATVIALLVSVYPSLLYAEMGAALPFSGGTYNYATEGIGRPAGMLAGWNFIIALVAVTSGEALAFSFYFSTLFEALGLSIPLGDKAIAVIIILIFIYTNYKGIEMTARLQNGFMFFFWGVAIVWFVTMIPNIDLNNFRPFIMPEGTSVTTFIGTVALVWWCFAGFETCCAMGEEIKHPQINIPRAMFLSPFIVFAVNAIFQWFLLGIVPSEGLEYISTSAAPYADAMRTAGILGFPLVLLAAGIAFGGDFSTLNASIAAPPRYLFSMARDGVVPGIFSKVHPKYKTPYISVMVLGAMSIIFILTGSLIYIASLSLFADLFYYIIGIFAAVGLRKKRPDLTRPYKAPGIMAGAAVSIVIYLIMMTQLEKDAVIFGIIWNILGLIVYKLYAKPIRNEDIQLRIAKQDEAIKSLTPPSLEEKVLLDKQFKTWRSVVAAACIISSVLYLIPYIF